MTDAVVVATGRAAAAVPQRVGTLHHRGADLHGRPAGHGRHARARSTSRSCRRSSFRSGSARRPADGHAGAGRHLARDPAGAHHALPAERRAIPPGALAGHRGRDRHSEAEEFRVRLGVGRLFHTEVGRRSLTWSRGEIHREVRRSFTGRSGNRGGSENHSQGNRGDHGGRQSFHREVDIGPQRWRDSLTQVEPVRNFVCGA